MRSEHRFITDAGNNEVNMRIHVCIYAKTGVCGQWTVGLNGASRARQKLFGQDMSLEAIG